jgi:hypothetical protein
MTWCNSSSLLAAGGSQRLLAWQLQWAVVNSSVNPHQGLAGPSVWLTVLPDSGYQVAAH